MEAVGRHSIKRRPNLFGSADSKPPRHASKCSCGQEAFVQPRWGSLFIIILIYLLNEPASLTIFQVFSNLYEFIPFCSLIVPLNVSSLVSNISSNIEIFSYKSSFLYFQNVSYQMLYLAICRKGITNPSTYLKIKCNYRKALTPFFV